MTVSACSIIEHLDVIEDIRAGQITCFVDTILDPLLFQATEEGLCYRVVPAVTTAGSCWAPGCLLLESVANHHCHIVSPDPSVQ